MKVETLYLKVGCHFLKKLANFYWAEKSWEEQFGLGQQPLPHFVHFAKTRLFKRHHLHPSIRVGVSFEDFFLKTFGKGQKCSFWGRKNYFGKLCLGMQCCCGMKFIFNRFASWPFQLQVEKIMIISIWNQQGTAEWTAQGVLKEMPLFSLIFSRIIATLFMFGIFKVVRI